MGATSSISTIKNESHSIINKNNVSKNNVSKNLYKPFLTSSADMSLTGGFGTRDKYSDTFTQYWSDLGVSGYEGFLRKYSKIKFRTQGSYLEVKFYNKNKYFSADGYVELKISDMFVKTHGWESAKYLINESGTYDVGFAIQATYHGSVIIQTRTDEWGIDIRTNMYVQGKEGDFGDYIKGQAVISEIEIY